MSKYTESEPSSFLGGVCESVYFPYSAFLRVRGWLIEPRDLEEIHICNEHGKVLGSAELNQLREDIYKQYPDHDRIDSGWIFEDYIPKDTITENLFAVAKRNNLEITKLRVFPHIEKQIEFEVNKIIKKQKVVFNRCVLLGDSHVYGKLKDLGFAVLDYKIDYKDYKKWFENVNYIANYPIYVKEYNIGVPLTAKSLQHYLSIKLTKLKEDDVCVDVASCNSVFPDILKNHHLVREVFRQDINYPEGIQNDRIGSSAAHIPLPDDSVDCMTLHCSWEHFEDGGDVDFFKESLRLLKERGRLCIIPLYLANDYAIMTSPSCWLSKYRYTDEVPAFDNRAAVYINEKMKQRQSKLYSPEILASDVLHKFKEYFDIRIHHFVNQQEVKGAPVSALGAVKR